ncbi:MAG: hypothetical protein IH624_11310 [Phycisphaerae bacterium]|nr:hypothetical protein [Phycisphaerae bacterium]
MPNRLVTQLFDRMDSWRHLPNYQLERRADLFFSLYLTSALEAKLRIPISPVIIPEFPVRIGTIYPAIPIDKSCKIDYVCFSADLNTSIFVELKTEGSSRREAQDKYLAAAKKAGFANLLHGLLMIFRATTAKRKYYHLLKTIEQAGFLAIPRAVHKIVQSETLVGLTSAAEKIAVTRSPQQCMVIYVQPNVPPDGQSSDIISFADFGSVVEKSSDPVSVRFAQSLQQWATVTAEHTP